MSDPKIHPVTNDDCACCGGINRRTVLQGLAALGAGIATAGPAFAQETPASMPPQVGDFLVLARGGARTALAPADIPLDAEPVDAWPQAPDGTIRRSNQDNRLMLFRFDPATLAPEVTAMAADGVIALSIICTHAGCDVSNRLPDGIMECPCHGSRFDPRLNGAVVLAPANRKLPQLALAVNAEGKITVTAGFDGKVGGDEVM